METQLANWCPTDFKRTIQLLVKQKNLTKRNVRNHFQSKVYVEPTMHLLEAKIHFGVKLLV